MVPIINVVSEKNICLTVLIYRDIKIKTMKALKILSLVLFSSMILFACEDNAVDPGKVGKPQGPATDIPVDPLIF